MSEIIINPKKESLRLSCGQCGDMHDLLFEFREDGLLSIEIGESQDIVNDPDDGVHCFLKPTHIVT